MFNVPQKHTTVKPHKDRGARIKALHEKGLTLKEIARDSEVVSMSGGFVLTRERVRQLLKREEQKTA